jgi:hypothetical protein
MVILSGKARPGLIKRWSAEPEFFRFAGHKEATAPAGLAIGCFRAPIRMFAPRDLACMELRQINSKHWAEMDIIYIPIALKVS